jgi:hypothetical protein
MMRGKGARGLAATAVIVAVAGCSKSPATQQREAPRTRVSLAQQHVDANAGTIADLVKQTCLDSIADPGAIEQALQNSGWAADQDVAAPAEMVTVWDLDHGRIAYSAIPFQAAGASFRDCQVEFDGAVAPSMATMRTALLSKLAGQRLEATHNGPEEYSWHWQPDPLQERDLTIRPMAASQSGARSGLSIHVGSAEFTTPRSVPQGNVQENTDR